MNMIALMLATAAAAQAVTLGPGSRLWLEGDSTLHTYSSKAETVQGSFTEVPGAAGSIEELIAKNAVKSLVVTVPVSGLKSGESGLDKNLRKALKADKFPDIVFTMADYRVDKSSAGSVISSRGELVVAGQKKQETLKASLEFKDGRAVIDGEQALLMTEFGIKPPALMLGAIKTKDRVVVKFHLVLQTE